MDPAKLVGKKRKRATEETREKPKASKSNLNPATDIDRLEKEILESRKNYNNIVKLQAIAFPKKGGSELRSAALLALCRTFCHLFADGSFSKTKSTSEAEIAVTQWLEDRY